MSEQTNPSQANNEPQKLRPMGFGDLLDAIFSLYRAHFLPFLAIASGYFIVILIVILIVFLDDSVGRGAKIAIWISAVSATFGVSIFVVSGLVFAGTEAYLGRKIRVGAVLRQVMRHFFQYFIGSLLFALLAILSTFFSILFIVLLLLFPSPLAATDIVNLIVGLSFFLISACFIVLFGTYCGFYLSAVSVEGKSIRAGLRRSRELIRGRRWRVIGTVLAIFLLPFAIGFVLRAVFAFLLVLTGLDGVGSFLETVRWMSLWELPTNLSELRLSYVLMYLINLGVDTFTIPIWVIGCTLLYFDQRIRKEGFDIETMATHQGE